MYPLIKRFFDISFALIGLISLSPVLILAFILSTFATSSFGIFRQKRIGIFGRTFTVYKIRTMYFCPIRSTFSCSTDLFFPSLV